MSKISDTNRLLNYRLKMLFKSHTAWVSQFKISTPAHFKKLANEATEAMDAPQDITEHADCLLVLFSAIQGAGFTLDEVVRAAQQKHLVNLTRQWNHKPDGTLQHIDICTCPRAMGLDNDENGTAYCIACHMPV